MASKRLYDVWVIAIDGDNKKYWKLMNTGYARDLASDISSNSKEIIEAAVSHKIIRNKYAITKTGLMMRNKMSNCTIKG